MSPGLTGVWGRRSSGFASLHRAVRVLGVQAIGATFAAWRFDAPVRAVATFTGEVQMTDPSMTWLTPTSIVQTDVNKITLHFANAIPPNSLWRITARPNCFNPRPLYIDHPQDGQASPFPP